MKIPNPLKLNSALGNPLEVLKFLRKKVIFRVALLSVVLVLTIVLVFAQTIAWQTNVVHTGGLMFTADTWNFSVDGSLISNSTPAAPGDSKVIGLQISNESANLAAASVKVSKEEIIEDMKHRMFFYVDTTAVRNGETVDRVYISNKSSYTYTLFPYETLELTEDSNDSAVIKWEWTYDNLGYYVYGKKTDDNKIQVEEYLRPIEYDFDFMRTTFYSDGSLETVDGKTTAATFLKNFSKTDGYEGEIDTSNVTSDGYYTVSINNETGYGVFAYLCTLDEINQGSVKDTELGSNTSSIGQAKVQLTGQNCRTDGVLVFDENSLTEALSTSGLNMLTLAKDIELTQTINVTDSSQVVIDLAGHTITSNAENIFTAKEGGSVMLNNGTIVAEDSSSTAVYTVAGTVALNDVTILNAYEGIKVRDNLSTTGGDSVVSLSNCTIKAQTEGLFIYGGGSLTSGNTKVVIENCNILGESYAGIVCNGTYDGIEMTIKNSTVKGYYTSIYFPTDDSTLTVETSVLEGYTGLAVKGGTVHLTNCKITGTGAYTELPDQSKLSKSGWWDTGDGVYLEANYSDRDTRIYIYGNDTEIIGTQSNTCAVRMYPSEAEFAAIEIFGGKYNTDVSDYVGTDYTLVKNSDTEYTVERKSN